jgi:hypothetical protein
MEALGVGAEEDRQAQEVLETRPIPLHHRGITGVHLALVMVVVEAVEPLRWGITQQLLLAVAAALAQHHPYPEHL